MSLWSAWQKEKTARTTVEQKQQQTITAKTANEHPEKAAVLSAIVSKQQKTPVMTVPEKRTIHVKTNVLNIDIDTLGGNIIKAKLPKYPVSLDKPDVPIQVLSDASIHLYTAESGLLGIAGDKPLLYKIKQKNYTLKKGQNTILVNLVWQNKQGLRVVKNIKFTRGSYAIDVDYKVYNETGKDWQGGFYTQIKRLKPEKKRGLSRIHTYTGAAISSPQKPYEKISYDNMDKEPLKRTTDGGWVAMQEHYFLSAWIPDQHKTHNYYSHVENNIYTIGMATPITIPTGKSQTFGAKLYVGPEITDNLKPLAKGLNLTVDYGWLWIISVAIFWVMQHIFNIIGNWGWSIVLVTILIKLIFFKFSETSYKSMAKMRTLAPQLKAIKERYGSDRQKMSQATMELYKKEKVNPIGGCLPMIIQIPFFIALYYVLIEAVQLRHAPFIFWIHDLSVKDPYYILPILMGASMFLSNKLNPSMADPAQAKMMMFLPLVFTVLFASFPAGLVLYWLVNNILSVLQQWYIIRKYEKEQARKKH